MDFKIKTEFSNEVGLKNGLPMEINTRKLIIFGIVQDNAVTR